MAEVVSQLAAVVVVRAVAEHAVARRVVLRRVVAEAAAAGGEAAAEEAVEVVAAEADGNVRCAHGPTRITRLMSRRARQETREHIMWCPCASFTAGLLNSRLCAPAPSYGACLNLQSVIYFISVTDHRRLALWAFVWVFCLHSQALVIRDRS